MENIDTPDLEESQEDIEEEKEKESESLLQGETIKLLENKGYKIGSHAGEESRNIKGETIRVVTFSHPLKEFEGKDPFDKKTMESLKELGVEIPLDEVPADIIRLELKVREEEGEPEVKARWNQVAAILPEVDSPEKTKEQFS